MFGKRKRAGISGSSSVSDSIGDGQLGDVFTVTGLSVEYEDSYFIIEKLNRYEGYSGTYSEFLGWHRPRGQSPAHQPDRGNVW